MDPLNPRPSLSSEGQVDKLIHSGQQRRTSFFRRISSSSEKQQSARSTGSGNMLFRKSTKDSNEEVAPEPVTKPRIPSFHFDAMSNHPPRFDSASYHPLRSPRRDIDHLGRPFNPQYSSAIPPVPPVPTMPRQMSSTNSSPAVEKRDPFVKTLSMTSTDAAPMKDRGRLRRKKDATPFNVLVVGSKGCGKTSFAEFLRSSLARPIKHPSTASPQRFEHGFSSSFPSQYLETDIDGERVGLTIYDSPGLERTIADLQLQEMTSFIESKFEETFLEEQKVLRTAGARDTHIHCVLLLLDPARLQQAPILSSPSAKVHPLSTRILEQALDVDFICTLNNLTTVVPIISKADTVTVAQMAEMKRKLFQELNGFSSKPLDLLDFDTEHETSSDSDDDSSADGDDDASSSSNTDDIASEGKAADSGSGATDGVAAKSIVKTPKVSTAFDSELPEFPMSIISPDTYEPDLVGRRFAWGFANPNDSTHCDYSRLKESVFSDWRDDLRDASRIRCYETWRTTRLQKRGGSPMSTHTCTGSNVVINSGLVTVPGPFKAGGSSGSRAASGSSTQHATSSIGMASGGTGNTPPRERDDMKEVVNGMQRL